MPRLRDPLQLVPPAHHAGATCAARSPRSPRSPFAVALLALLAVVASPAGAQGRAAAETPLHVASSRFEFVASSDTQPPAKPLGVHNGGAAVAR